MISVFFCFYLPSPCENSADQPVNIALAGTTEDCPGERRLGLALVAGLRSIGIWESKRTVAGLESTTKVQSSKPFSFLLGKATKFCTYEAVSCIARLFFALFLKLM